MERRNAWLSYGENEEKEMEQIAKSYKSFLDAGKTERECVTELIRQAEAAGYVSMEKKLASGEKIQAGDKVYSVAMNKILAFSISDRSRWKKGMNILGAHIDSPVLTLNRILFMKRLIWHIWILITTAA